MKLIKYKFWGGAGFGDTCWTLPRAGPYSKHQVSSFKCWVLILMYEFSSCSLNFPEERACFCCIIYSITWRNKAVLNFMTLKCKVTVRYCMMSPSFTHTRQSIKWFRLEDIGMIQPLHESHQGTIFLRAKECRLILVIMLSLLLLSEKYSLWRRKTAVIIIQEY